MKYRIKIIFLKIYFKYPKLCRFLGALYMIPRLYIKKDNKRDQYQKKILKRLNHAYKKNDYSKYMDLFLIHQAWLLKEKLSKYFSWAATIKKGTRESFSFIETAISINPSAINDITTGIVVEAYPDKNHINKRLYKAAMQSKYYTPIISTYCLLKQNRISELKQILNNPRVQDIYSAEELIESFSLIRDYQKVVDLFEIYKDKVSLSILSYERTYDALTHLRQLNRAQDLFNLSDKIFNPKRTCLNKEINPHAINNKLERQFWFQKNDLKKASRTYRRQKLSQMLKNVFKERYVQELKTVAGSKAPLVLASWGPGDEIRFSKLYNQLTSLNPNVTISCEPRLKALMLKQYPSTKFRAVNRTRRVDAANQSLYCNLPNKKLHHILDNKTYLDIDKYDHICLVTDLLSDLIDKLPNEFNEREGGTVPKLDVVSKLKKDAQTILVGISWRSSIQTASRNQHYFSIKELAPIFSLHNAKFINLQYGDCKNEIEEIETNYDVKVFQPEIDQYNDFEGVVDLMKQLDYILSAGTTVLELSGLSGTSTFALTNNTVFNHRCKDENRDLWFSNIRYVSNFTTRSKYEVVEEIKNSISNEQINTFNS